MRLAFNVLLLFGVLCVSSSTSATKNRIRVEPPADRYFSTLLSFDGGGFRLYMTNQILKELEAQIKNYYMNHTELLPEDAGPITSPDQLEIQLADFFTCISGVSAGSWTGLYYASKGGDGTFKQFLSRPDIVQRYGDIYPGSSAGLDVFFLEFGRRIYPPGFLGFHFPRVRMRPFDFSIEIPGLNSPIYPVDGLEDALAVLFGDTTLTDLHTSVVVHAYDVHERNPLLFTYNHENEEPYSTVTLVQARNALILPGRRKTDLPRNSSKLTRGIQTERRDFYLRDLGRASSALPAVHAAKEFSPVGVADMTYLCIDGVLVEQNPTTHSLNFMMERKNFSEIDKLAIMTFGTGGVLGQFSMNVGSGAGWLISGDLINIINDGGSEAAQSNLHHFAYEQLKYKEGQLLRIQVYAEEDSEYAEALNSFTNADQLSTLKEIGIHAAERFHEDIIAFVQNFIFGTKEKDSEVEQTT